jgi:hypothetical protein
MNDDTEALRRALRRLPAPQPSTAFVDAAFARATGHSAKVAPRSTGIGDLLRSWHLWLGVALGSAVAATLTVTLLRPAAPVRGTAAPLAFEINETRNIDVLIDSERALKDASIRIVASGSVTLDGFQDEHMIDWRTDLEKGSNLLTLPIVARTRGPGQIVAVIEHEGRTRTVTIDLQVRNPGISRS